MSLRLALAVAAVTAAGMVLSPVFALQSIQIPDPSAPAGAQSDPLDSTASDKWQEQKGNGQSTDFGKFHFTVNSSSGWGSSNFGSNGWSQTPSTYGDPKTPGSEFYQPMPGYAGSGFPH